MSNHTLPQYIQDGVDELERRHHERKNGMVAKQEIMRAHEDAQAPVELTPMGMIEQAVTQGASVETLEKLMGLQERWEANQAKKAFDAALASARSELPTILKTQQGHNYKYEDLPAISKVVDPILTQHGLSYRWNTESNGTVTVTCIIAHRDGHSEQNSLTANSDTSGSKNPIQALGSAVTYLQRYTLKAALGLSASKDGDGGDGGDGGSITPAQLKILSELADEVAADKEKFCRYLKVDSLADIPASQFARAKAALESKRSAA